MSRRRSSPRAEYIYAALDVMCSRGHQGGRVVLQHGHIAWDGTLNVIDRNGALVDCWGPSSAPPAADARLRLRCDVCGADGLLRWEGVETQLREVAQSPTQHRTQLRLP